MLPKEMVMASIALSAAVPRWSWWSFHAPSTVLSAYTDGELEPGDVLRLERHLHACAACRTTVEAYLEVGDSVRGLSRKTVPATLRQGVLDRLPHR